MSAGWHIVVMRHGGHLEVLSFMDTGNISVADGIVSVTIRRTGVTTKYPRSECFGFHGDAVAHAFGILDKLHIPAEQIRRNKLHLQTQRSYPV